MCDTCVCIANMNGSESEREVVKAIATSDAFHVLHGELKKELDANGDAYLSQLIAQSAGRVREWLNDFIYLGDIPSLRVEETLNDLKPTMAAFVGRGKWFGSCEVKIRAGFADALIFYEIVLPILSGKGEMFSRIRKCPECEKYFFAKDIRKMFCSNGCRSTHAYKKKVREAA